jgi:hypothetical protein
VRVAVEGHGHRSVPQAFGDDFGVHAGTQELRGVRVA